MHYLYQYGQAFVNMCEPLFTHCVNMVLDTFAEFKYDLVVKWMFNSTTKTLSKSKPMNVQLGAFRQQS